jgi:2-oxoglutarate ferredoxin oxidoreductase subunit beta
MLALANHASFVARGFVGDVTHLKELMKAAIQHKGFALVDILQVCITFNRAQTYKYYRDRVYKLEEENHDPTDFKQAIERSQEAGNRIPIGIFYKKERPVYRALLPQLEEQPLVRSTVQPKGLDALLQEFL